MGELVCWEDNWVVPAGPMLRQSFYFFYSFSVSFSGSFTLAQRGAKSGGRAGGGEREEKGGLIYY